MAINNTKGTYALILECHQEKAIRIGKRGELTLKPGFYVYLGSAFGSGGLTSRLKHHKGISQKPHWHIDYLRKHCKLVAIWFTCDTTKREHDWAQLFMNTAGTSIPLTGFGSSDCQCKSHLVYLQQQPNHNHFCKAINKQHLEHDSILNETM